MQRMTNTNYSAQVVHGEYYPHIDGIRALAVLPVMFFHILATLCPGGFAGVDVFFVISGYLITGGILRDLKSNRFTIRNFYYRRIRRIMPAYFALIAGVFVAGCTLYYDAPLTLLSSAVISGTLFVANFHFWNMAGDYFAPALHTQALLHLWSLSVEEQFYLFIPLLCATIYKFRRRLVTPALALLAVLSLSGSIYAVMNGKQDNAFYLLHFRAWELLAGSLLATLPVLGSPRRVGVAKGETGSPLPASHSRHAFLATVGLLMVLITYAVISSKTPFPGAAALAPVIGTTLLIRYGQSGWVSRLLSCRPLVLTGKISYSLYLWHWPVIVFWRYAVYDDLCFYDYIGMFCLSLLLGYLSWKFVELPVRTSPLWTMRRAFVFTAAGIAFLVTLGCECMYYRGWPTILHPNANEVTLIQPRQDPLLRSIIVGVMRRVGSTIGHKFKVVTDHDSTLSADAPFANEDGRPSIGNSGQPKIFLLGDSHAGSLRYGLGALLQEKSMAGYDGSHSDADAYDLRLPDTQSALSKLSELSSVSHVILAQMWAREYFRKRGRYQDYEIMIAQFEEFALHIKSLRKTLLIATDIPYYPYPPAETEARSRIITPRQVNIILESRQQSEVEYDRVQREINSRLEVICKKTGAVLIPLHLAFKQDDHYVPFEEQGGKTVPLYSDTDHLTRAGSLRAARFIMPYFFPKRTENNRLLGAVDVGVAP